VGEITKSPLSWPSNVARTPPHQRQNARFGDWSITQASVFVLEEINRLNERGFADYEDGSVVISTNLRYKLDGMPYGTQPQPADSGAAVYFNLRFARGGRWHERPVVLSCDKWTRVEWNLYAISKDIEAQRGRHRWGCTNVEQAFRGYTAIPEQTGGLAWWQVLGIMPTSGEIEIREAFRVKAMTEHPDKGGSQERWLTLQQAFEQGLSKTT
jgi:hypothetical protein